MATLMTLFGEMKNIDWAGKLMAELADYSNFPSDRYNHFSHKDI